MAMEELKSNLEDLALAKQSEEVKQKAQLEEAELKGNIIDVQKQVENYAKKPDGSIDRKKASTFGLNMSKFGYFSYPEFSNALNLQQIQDKKIIQDQNKGIKEKEIDKILKKTYTQKIKEMMDNELPEGTKIETFLGSANQAYNKITGAYMEGTYKSDIPKTTAFEIKNDRHLDNDEKKEKQEANTEELTAHEMKKTSKDLMKFLNSESLSSQERQQIRFFIKTVANIDRKTTNDKPIEKQILEYFASTPDSLSFTKENRMEANKIEGLTIKESDAKRLQKLNQLYYQSMNGQNQTLRRLFYIISQEGSIAEAKTNFDGSMSTEKETVKNIRKETRKLKGEINSAAGTVLNYQEKDLAKYQAYINQIQGDKTERKTIINAITDFDLDGFITHKDAGNKTGLQIQKIISDFGEENALDNILALVNKIGEKSGVKEYITKENLLSDPAYLILVQNTLKDPSFDITDIVRYGNKTVENIYNLSETSAETINTQAEKMINELKNKGIPVEAGLKDILSTTILKAYADYGYVVGIPLDSFIKGLSFNLGLAHFPSGAEDFGINIGRNGRKLLGKGREATAGISGGTTLIFIPMASAQGGFIKTLDNKKQSTSLDVRSSKKIQISGHAIVMPGYAGYGASMGMEKSKRDSILEQSPRLQSTLTAFFAKILEPKEGEKTFTFDKTELETKLQDALKESFKNSKKDTITKAVNNISLILAAYDGLPKEKIGEASVKIAEAYANARVNQSAKNIDNKRYLGGAGLSVTFFEGIIPVVGVLTFKKNKITSYNDTNPEMIKSAENSGTGNEKYKNGISKLIEEINKNTGSEIKLEGELITIPKSTRTEKNLEIRIHENMKGLIKTDLEGNLILHKDTPIRFFDAYLSDRGRKVLNIGELSSTEGDKKLDSKNIEVPSDFITKDEILKEKLPVKIDPNTENVNQILDNLRKDVEKADKDNIVLKDIKAEVTGSTIVFKNENIEVGKLENITNQSKITISKKTDGKLSFEKGENKDQKRLTIKYIEKIEKSTKNSHNFDEIGEDISGKIDKVYEEGRQIQGTLFHEIIKTHFSAKEYGSFNKNLKEKKYEDARNDLIGLLTNIRKLKGNENKFEETLKNLEEKTEEFELIKLLSAFNVFLSRRSNVQINKEGKYVYRYGGKTVEGEKVLQDSQDRIKGSFLRKFDADRPEDKSRLTQPNINLLFSKIDQKRAESKIDFSTQTKTKNAISFNHGNPQDFFKLQVNPELAGLFKVGLDELEKDDTIKDFVTDLKQAYINQLVKTESNLLNNMFTKLGVSNLPDKEGLISLFNKNEKGLDIEGKIYKIDYDQSFGYNPECNNLVRLMENLKITVNGGSSNDVEEEKTYQASIQGNELAINYGETYQQANMQTKAHILAIGGSISKEKQETTPGQEEKDKKEDKKTTPNENETDQKEDKKTTPSEKENNANQGNNGNNTTNTTNNKGNTGSKEGERKQ